MSTVSERKPKPVQPSRYDIAALKEDLDGIALIDEAQVVRKRSRDFFWDTQLNLSLVERRRFSSNVECNHKPDSAALSVG